MADTSSTILTFYQQLGKIFYSIAAIDNVVRKQEVERLRQILKNEWIPLEDSIDEFGTDSAYQIEIAFDWLLENEWSDNHENVLSDFEFFKKEHPSFFSDSANKLIIKTANAIASSFAGKNKSETEFLKSLKKVISNS